ncbi:hypothetical protein [Microbacterium sp. NPDC076911]|uniref:hypothetical protein n=1 Tax=Microbacterium sp. NPDC076911 TaxID=3154958 RepID=UPI003429BFD6
MRQSRAPRVARGVVAASVATFVALLSHVAAGGAMPHWLGIGVPWVLSAMVCTVLAGRSLSLLRLSLSVAISQFLFHTLFILGSTSSAGEAATGHVHNAVQLLPVGASAESVVPADAAMWIGHGVAALITAAALYRGERAVMRLRTLAGYAVSWVRRRIQLPVALAFTAPLARPAADRSAWHVSSVPQRSALQYRGPPVLSTL